ncbi:MAG: hypothetical protein ACRC8S_18885 [Fimbriiglobus sp.]
MLGQRLHPRRLGSVPGRRQDAGERGEVEQLWHQHLVPLGLTPEPVHLHEPVGDELARCAVEVVKIAGVGDAEPAVAIPEPMPTGGELGQLWQPRPVPDGVAGCGIRHWRFHLRKPSAAERHSSAAAGAE